MRHLKAFESTSYKDNISEILDVFQDFVDEFGAINTQTRLMSGPNEITYWRVGKILIIDYYSYDDPSQTRNKFIDVRNYLRNISTRWASMGHIHESEERLNDDSFEIKYIFS